MIPRCEIHEGRHHRTVMVDSQSRRRGEVSCTVCCKVYGRRCDAHWWGDLCSRCRPTCGVILYRGERMRFGGVVHNAERRAFARPLIGVT